MFIRCLGDVWRAIVEFSSEVIDIELTGQVATMWLNRPEKHNAMSMVVVEDIHRAMTHISSLADVRAVVVAGRGKSFCVGLDLSALASISSVLHGEGSPAQKTLDQLKITTAFQESITSVADCPVPVIAAIHSNCIGAGVDLITACDIRIATKDTTFSVRETKMGLAADVGTLQRLPTIITKGHVAELVYTGKDIDGVRAEKIGLVNDLYADFDAVYKAAMDMAQEIAANAPLAVKGSKFILDKSEDLTTEQSLLLNGLWTMSTNLNSNDIMEAVQAFMQKRPPNFTGS